MTSVLDLRKLSKRFETHAAVDGISLSIQPGEFFSLVGPSGCGKTTTLRLIAGFETPTEGDILLNGTSLCGKPPYERNVSTVFQNYALFPHLTVAQNVAFGLERRREAKHNIRQKISETLSLVRLSGKESRLPHQISGGERQRVALARSLVLAPQVLLLDEPLSALDPKLRKQMRAELKNIQRTVGITFVFITHDQEEALSLSDRMAVMNNGRIEQIGTPKELYQRPTSRFAAEFLGDVNWVNGAGVRPESVRISRDHPGEAVPSLPATVRDCTFLGSKVYVETCLPDGLPCTVEVDERRNGYIPGESVHLWWSTSDELRVPH